MSRDGSWQDDPITLPPMTEERWREDVTALQAQVRERDLLIAAIVTAHGEALGTGRYRLAVPPEHLDSADARRLSIHRDPNSGAVLLRVSPI